MAQGQKEVCNSQRLRVDTEPIRSASLQMMARLMRLVVMAILFEQVCGARLTGPSPYCTGYFCRQQQAKSHDKKPDVHLTHLLKSRISNIYNNGRRSQGEANNEKLFETNANQGPSFPWRNLLGESSAKNDRLLLGRSAKGYAKHLGRFNLKTQRPKHAAIKFSPAAKRQDLPENLGGPPPQISADLAWHPAYQPEAVGKRQQGWHIQYGKRDSIEVDHEETLADSEHNILPDMLPSKRMGIYQVGLGSGRVLDVPSQAMDFLFLSKSLSYSNREGLARKLTSVLENIVQGGERVPQNNEGEEEEEEGSDERGWVESSTLPYDSVGQRHGSLNMYSGNKRRLGAKNEGVMLESNQGSEVSKRQQGWHINYGKRDGNEQPYF
ncbi:hypothetical protein ElyMa_006390200 [Elysia marginata]|uniref:Uncharacterized protein n=1 Tax=Elysia marginata TaxID=1093978 RepID=A0AAV4HRV1_9GAST|nr:hypothetical protein ElyMa_006390200 [Elysia marginata]